jgi:hypothetical protein
VSSTFLSGSELIAGSSKRTLPQEARHPFDRSTSTRGLDRLLSLSRFKQVDGPYSTVEEDAE